MKKQKIEFTTRLTREDVAGIMEALMEGLKDGVLKVHKSNEVLELSVPRVVDLEIEAEIDDQGAEFELEISWRTNRAEPDSVPDEWEGEQPGAWEGEQKDAAPEPRQPQKAASAARTGKKTSRTAAKKPAKTLGEDSKKRGKTPAAPRSAAGARRAKTPAAKQDDGPAAGPDVPNVPADHNPAADTDQNGPDKV